MRRISPPFGAIARRLATRRAQPGFCSRYSTTAQAMARDTRLASAAPMTPMPKP